MLDGTQNSGTVVSLFAGCGGLDYGFSKAGYKVVSAFDSDQSAVKCYNQNHQSRANIRSIGDDLTLECTPEIIIAGPPCQGFSTGGGYKDGDPRNALLLVTCRIIAKSGARLAVIENVAALTNTRNSSHLQAALALLEGAGYTCSLEVYSASEFGVPQTRKRTVIFARRGDGHFRCPEPKKGQVSSVRNSLSSMPLTLDSHDVRFPPADSKHAIIAKKIRPGQKLCNVRGGEASVPTWDIPEWFGPTTEEEKSILIAIRSLRRRNRKRHFGDADPLSLTEIRTELIDVSEKTLASLIERDFLRKVGANYDLKHTFNGKYRRLDLKGFSPTVDTRFGDIQLFLHPTEDRALTVREAARLQGFPDSFLFAAYGKEAFRLIGNAVPPPMSTQLAIACKELLV